MIIMMIIIIIIITIITIIVQQPASLQRSTPEDKVHSYMHT